MTPPIDSQIEAILFWKGEPMKREALVRACSCTEAELNAALGTLRERLTGRGVVLIENGDEVTLATGPAHAARIATLTKEEREGEIGAAGLEALTIVLYRGPISRREIEYIRGVNSQFTLRTLLIRGLIERIQNERDERVPLYRGTLYLLAHLGIGSRSELPHFEDVSREIVAFEENKNEKEAAGDAPEQSSSE